MNQTYLRDTSIPSQKSSLNHLSNNLTYNSNKQYKLTTLNLGLLDDEDLPSLSHQDVSGLVYYLITSFPSIEIPEITIQRHSNYRDVQDMKHQSKMHNHIFYIHRRTILTK